MIIFCRSYITIVSFYERPLCRPDGVVSSSFRAPPGSLRSAVGTPCIGSCICIVFQSLKVNFNISDLLVLVQWLSMSLAASLIKLGGEKLFLILTIVDLDTYH